MNGWGKLRSIFVAAQVVIISEIKQSEGEVTFTYILGKTMWQASDEN